MGTAMLYGTVLLLVVLSSTSVNGDRHLHVFALPVGQGDATVIQCPDADSGAGKLTIIDMGSSSCVVGNCMGKEEIKRFIGNRKVEYIFLTHPDIDHYNLIHAVFDNVEENVKLYHPCVKSRYTYGQRQKKPLDDLTTKRRGSCKRIQQLDCSEDDYVASEHTYSICGGKAFITVMASELVEKSCVRNKGNPNEASLVLQLKYEGQKVLFVGDLDGEAVEKVIECGIKSNALRLAHHGSRERGANSDTFLKKVNADIAIVSSDPERQGYKHPDCEIFNWYNKNKKYYRGMKKHDVVCKNDKGAEAKKGYKRDIWSTTPRSSFKTSARYRSKIIDLEMSPAGIAPSHQSDEKTLDDLAPYHPSKRKQRDESEDDDAVPPDDDDEKKNDDDGGDYNYYDHRQGGTDDEDDEDEDDDDESDEDDDLRKPRYYCKLCRTSHRFKHTHKGVDYMVPL